MRTRKIRTLVWLVRLAAIAALLPLAVTAAAEEELEDQGDPPPYHTGDPGAPVVTPENLLESDRFWPFRVSVVEPWAPGAPLAPLKPGLSGILLRVSSPTTARVDFGRRGRFDVPIETLDLLARANEVRLGKLVKRGPNLVEMIGAQTVDAATLLPIPHEEMARRRGFLCVVANPDVAEFEALAAELAALPARDEVASVLFAEGEFPPRTLAARLRSLGWAPAFVFDHMAEGLAAALLPEGAKPPTLLLLSPEGRLLHAGDWRPGSSEVGALAAALEAAFGAGVASSEDADASS